MYLVAEVNTSNSHSVEENILAVEVACLLAVEVAEVKKSNSHVEAVEVACLLAVEVAFGENPKTVEINVGLLIFVLE